MGKFRKGKILAFVVLMMIVSFFAFAGKVEAKTKVRALDQKLINLQVKTCPDDLNITMMVNGKDITSRYDSYAFMANKSCTKLLLPESGRYLGLEYYSEDRKEGKKEVRYGVLAWYDNPELTGDPIDLIDYNPKNPTHRTFYAKLAPTLTSIKLDDGYFGGYPVIGKTYDITAFSARYVYGNIMDNSTAHLYNDYDADFYYVPDEFEDNSKMFRRIDDDDVRLEIDSSDLFSIADLDTCETRYWNTLCLDINRTYYTATTLRVYDIDPIERLYEVTDTIDESGKSYGKYITILPEYEGKHFYTVTNGPQLCRNVQVDTEDIIQINQYRLDGDENYSGKINIKDITTTTTDPSYVKLDENGSLVSFNTCLNDDIYMKIHYNIDPSIVTTEKVTIHFENGDYEQVDKGTNYTLPSAVPNKSASVTNVRFKYQDGTTSDTVQPYTTIYEPDSFVIKGFKYAPSYQFVVNEDTDVFYSYNETYSGTDFPTPTRQNYIFAGWYTAADGGELVTDYKTAIESRTLYAHWVEKDKVFVVRPDGITVQLYKGSEFTMPDIPYKNDETIARVRFIYNDGTDKTTMSNVTKHFTKNGIACKETGTHYNVGQTIVVNENMVLLGDYTETIKPATFPMTPERTGYSFLGWYNQIEEGTKYTEYSGNEDISLYAHWNGDDNYIYVTYPDGYCYYDETNTRQCLEGKQIEQVEKGTQYKLKEVNNKSYASFVDFYWGEEDYWSILPEESPYIYTSDVSEEEIANGWYIDGDFYEEGQTITADKDILVTKDTVDVKHPAEFPEDPVREGYTFNGWVDYYHIDKTYTTFYDARGLVEGNYPNPYFILIADWEKIEGEYTLPEIPAKNPETIATVTLKFQDGITKDKKKYVKKNYTAVNYTVDGGQYDNELFNVGDTIVMSDDVTITPNYEEEIIPVELYSATRDGYMFAGWYDQEEGGTRYYNYSGTEDITLYAQWTTEPIANVCRRATTLHTSGGKTYGNLGTPGKLVPGDAFDCDVNGDGIYDEETERFYYVNDYWDAENDEFVESVASLIYYTDYYNGPLDSTSTKGFVKYGNTVPNDGPNVAATILPTTDEWSNVSLYKTVRQLSWPNNAKTNSNGDLGTFDYSGYAAHMLNGVELFKSGCLYSYNNKILAQYYNLNNSCSFLTENTRKSGSGRNEASYWIESPGGYCPSGYCPADRITPDFNKYGWELVTKSGNEYSSYLYQAQIEWTRGVRPVIDVPKASMEEVPEHTIYHTITYPEGQQQTSIHGSTFVFGDVIVTNETSDVATVTFKYAGDDGSDVTSNVKVTKTPVAYKIGNTRYDKGNELIVLDDYQLEYIYVDTITPATFPTIFDGESDFKGWYDAEAGGNKYTSYSGTRDIVLYPRFIDDYIEMPTNNIPKEDEIINTVTFKYHNGNPDTTSSTVKSYIPNGWNYYSMHINDGELVESYVLDEAEPDYIVNTSRAMFPGNPTKDGYEFVGWFTEETGGDQVFSLDTEDDITLHAHYTNNYALLKSGPDFNAQVKDFMIANPSSKTYNESFTDILSWWPNYPIEEAIANATSDNIISKPESPYPIYLFYDPEAGYFYYTEADIIYLDSDCSGMFEDLKFDILDMMKINASKVTNMSNMFKNAEAGIVIPGIDTHNVTTMSGMFYGSHIYDEEWDAWTNDNIFKHMDTSNVTDMSYMYYGAQITEKNLCFSYDTHNVTTMESMYENSNGLEWLGTSSEGDYVFKSGEFYDLSSVTTMKNMFAGSDIQYLSIVSNSPNLTNISGMFKNATNYAYDNLIAINTSNVTDMSDMFNGCTSLESLDLSTFTLNSVEDMSNMFANTDSLKTIYVAEAWDASGATYSDNMFENATSIVGQKGTTYDANHTDKEYAIIDDAPTNPGYLTNVVLKNRDAYVITFPDGTKEYVYPDTEWAFPTNKSTRADEDGATVTFDYQNGDENTTAKVTNQYLASGWKIGNTHYDDGEIIVVNSDLTLAYDYVTTYISPEFPTEMTREGYEFVAWFDAPAGGNRYESYAGVDDITLYAHWNLVGTPDVPDYLCRRSTDVVETEGGQYFGNDGFVEGEYSPGDIFICDVNGDGTFDDDTERFYYVSDYYDTETGEFDEDYAALFYFTSINGDQLELLPYSYYDEATDYYGIEYSTNNTTANGPESLMDRLPSTSKWSNVTLKTTTRKIVNADGNEYGTADYSGKAARLLTLQEIMHSCNGTLRTRTDRDFVLEDSNCAFLLHNAGHLVEWEESEFGSEPWVLRSNFYWLETAQSATQAYYSYIGNTDSTIESTYFPIVTGASISARPVIDVPKSQLSDSVEDPVAPVYYTVTYPDGTVELYPKGTQIVIPSTPDNTGITATVTFKYNNGDADTTSTVSKTTTYNGILIDDTTYAPKSIYVLNKDIVMEYDSEYVETGAEFPEEPTRDGYEFKGWYDANTAAGGNKYTSYDGEEDLTLYARWTKGICTDGDDYTLGTNDTEKESEVISTVTFVYHNGTADTTANVTKAFMPNGWLVDDVPRQDGQTIKKCDSTEIKPNYTEFMKNASFPEDPTKDGYEFVGWFTEETGGEPVTVLRGTENITVHAQYTNDYALLLKGQDFYKKIRDLTWYHGNRFRKATEAEFNLVSATMETKNIVSTADSPKTVYAWVSDEDILYYSDADVIFMNPDSSYMFTFAESRVTNIDLSGLNSSKVTRMDSMFASMSQLTQIDLSTLDTHNVTTFWRMFTGCTSLRSVDLSMLDTQNVTLFAYMFKGCTSLRTVNMSNIDTSSATQFHYMFEDCSSLTGVDMSGWDTRNLEALTSMFKGCTSLTELDLSSFDTSNVCAMGSMFYGDSNLRTVYVSDKWTTENLAESQYGCGGLTPRYGVFGTATSIVGQKGTTYDPDHADSDYAIIDDAPEHPGYLTYKGYEPVTYTITYPDGSTEVVYAGTEFTFPRNNSTKDIAATATVTFKYNDGRTPDYTSYVGTSYEASGWKIGDTHYNDGDVYIVNSDITLVYDYVEVQSGAEFPEDPTRNGYTFKGWYDALAGGDKYTSYNDENDLTLYARWEQGECENPTEYNLGTNDTPKADETISTVTFVYHNDSEDTASNVVRHYEPNGWLVDGELYSNGSTITKCDYTVIEPYYSSAIRNAEFPSDPVKDGYEFVGWFTEETGGEQVTVLRGDQNITVHAHYTDNYALLIKGQNFSNKMRDITSSYTYSSPGLSFRKATAGEYNSALSTLTDDNIVSTEDSPKTVYLWLSGTNLLYYSEADTIFMNPDSINMLALPDKIGSIDATGLNSSKVTSMKTLFGSETVLTTLNQNFDTHNVTDMSYMFSSCSKLRSVDLSNFDTSSLTTMQSMFTNSGLSSIDFSSFDTHNVTNMSSVFYGCNYLSTIDLNVFDTSNVTTMNAMFANTGLRTVNISNFNTSNVENMAMMFYGNDDLVSLDLRNFDTSNVTNMSNMLYWCMKVKEFDLSSFDTSKVTNMNYMFGTDYALRTIYVSDKWNTDAVTSSTDMFYSTTKLVGQEGTTFNSTKVDKEYARIDEASQGRPGYLTLKQPVFYTITYPDGETEKVLAGTEFKFPSNVPEKDIENIAKVTFKPENDTEDIIRYVTKSYSNPGWKIEDTHYDIGDTYIVNNDITLAYDYVETIIGVEFPSNPVLEGDTFLGWFDAKTDGNRVTSYNGTENVTFYAHWENGGIPSSDILCRRAKTLHTEHCEQNPQYNTEEGTHGYIWANPNNLYCKGFGYSYEGEKGTETITYGSLGTEEGLQIGDAFDCDVNGDGKFDAETERFYYTSDYYDTNTKQFDSNYATLVYYTSLNNGVSDPLTGKAYSTLENRTGPAAAINELPTTAEWSNVSLKDTTRTILNVKGQEISTFSYEGRAARLLTAQEVINSCELEFLYPDDPNDENVLGHVVDNCTHLLENTSFRDPDTYAAISERPDLNDAGYWLETFGVHGKVEIISGQGNNIHTNIYQEPYSDYDGNTVRPVIDVPKDRIDLTLPTRYKVSIDSTEVAEIVSGEEYTVIENQKEKSGENVATVTFMVDDEVYSRSYVASSYTPDGYTLNGKHYNAGDKIRVTEDIDLTSDYIETLEGAEFPEDPTDDEYDFLGWYDGENKDYLFSSYDGESDITLYALFDDGSDNMCTVTFDDGEILVVECGTDLELPDDEIETDDRTLTFNYNDGVTPNETITYKVTRTLYGYGYKDDIYTGPPTILRISEDTYLRKIYNEPVYSGEFPEVSDESFIGWFSALTDGTRYADYKEYRESNTNVTTLYAHYEQAGKASVILDGEVVAVVNIGDTYTMPAGVDYEYEEVGTVTLINGEDTSTIPIYRDGEFDHFDIDGTSYNTGDTITVNDTVYIYSKYTNELIYADLPTLRDTDYQFFDGWYTEPDGKGTRYTGTYYGKVDITLYSYFVSRNVLVDYYRSKDDQYLLEWASYYYGDVVDTSYIHDDEIPGNSIVTFDYNNGTGYTSWDQIYVTREIDHWIDDNDKVYNIIYTVDFGHGKDLYAVFGNNYIVNYQLYDLDSSSNPGYDFTGWYTKPQGGTRITKITEDKDITVYAHWKRNDDNICRYSTGGTEDCELGDTLRVPETRYSIASRVTEIINADGLYKDLYYGIIDVYRVNIVEYYEINGTKYYPGDEYTIEENPYIEVHYSDSYIEPAMLDEMDEYNVEIFFGDQDHKFVGWSTTRDGDYIIPSYAGEEDITVYGKYALTDDETYHVTFEVLDGYIIEQDLKAGTKIILGEQYVSDSIEVVPFTLRIDNPDDTKEYIKETGLIRIEPNRFSVNGNIKNKGALVIVDRDLYIKTLSDDYTITYSPEIVDPVREGYLFLGWRNWTNDPVDIENLTAGELRGYYSSVLSGGFSPIGDDYVTVDFDGKLSTVEKGDGWQLGYYPVKPNEQIYITLDSLREEPQYLAINKNNTLDGYLINGVEYEPGIYYTFNEDTVIRSQISSTYEYDEDYGVDYPELPVPEYDDFLGWYDAVTGGNEVEDASTLEDGAILYARYPQTYRLTVDGETTYVPEGYVYTVPTAGGELSDYITITLDYNYDDITKDVKIGYGKSISYQKINGTFYEPNEIYIVNEDTDIESITYGDDKVVMNPEISRPEREDYVFQGWYRIDDEIPVDIYSLTPEDKWFDGRTLVAYWFEEQDPEEYSVVRYIDTFYRTDMTWYYPKGYLFSLSSSDETFNLTSAIDNNMDDEVIYYYVTTFKDLLGYTVNGDHYDTGSEITLTEDYYEIATDVETTTTRNCGDEDCPSVLFQDINTRYGDYIFNGIYDDDDNLVDLSKIEVRSSEVDQRYYNLHIRYTSEDEYIILTVDGEVSIIPKGMGNIPDAKYKEPGTYEVRYDYNNGTNKVVTDYINVTYTFDHYNVEGKGNYNAGAEYNYLEDTTMNSVYSREFIYPEMRTIKTENFLGWYTEPHGGEEVTTLEGVTGDITLYARYNNDHVTIYIDGEPNPVLYGEEFTLPDNDGLSDNSITFTLNYNYDNRIEDYTINTSYAFTGYEMDGNIYEEGYTFEATEDKYVTSQYELTNTFTPEYTEPEREGYIFNGWFDGTTKVNVSELNADNVEMDGKTLVASWTEVTANDVVITYDGERMVVPKGTTLSELGESPNKPSTETFTVYIDRNNGTFIIDTYEITKTYSLDKVYINGEELNENDYTFNEDAIVTTSYTASYAPNIFEGLTSDISGIFTEPTGGVKVENYDNVNDGDTLYYQYGETHTITVDGEVIATVPHGSEYTLPVNSKAKAMENIAEVTFDYGDDREPYVTYVRNRYNPNGWSINDEPYTNNEKIIVNEDIVLEREYYETIQGIDFPRTPNRAGYRFDGWYYNDEVITSYSGTDDITINAKWIKQIVITNLVDDTITVVDEGTTEVLTTRPDKEEKYYNITFKYNYENSPEDKVVRISTQNKFSGWLVNGTFYDIDSEVTYVDNTTLQGSYTKEINNKNLPSDPTRSGYTFVGWYTKASNGELVDITKIDTDSTVYAHWEDFDPKTEVKVTWDGKVEIYPKGTTVALDREEGKAITDRVATITFNMNNDNYDNMTVYVNKVSTRDHYEINGVDHAATGDYTFNEDTVINSVYSEETTYPKLPIVSDNTFKGFYTAREGGEEVTTLEGIDHDATYYAHWETEMIPVTFDGEVTEYPKGTEITLPSGKAKDSSSINITLDYGAGYKEVTITTAYTFDDYSVNGVSYSANDKYIVNIPTTIISRYESETTNNFVGYDNNNWDLGYENSQGTLTSWLDANDNEFDLNTLTGEDDNHDGDTYTANYSSDVPSTINVTIDSMAPYEQETGKHMLIPSDKELTLDTPADETFTITFNNKDTESTVTGTKSYEFSHFTVDGVGTYQRNDDYTFYKDTVISSAYTDTYSYSGDIPEVSDELFIGWFTQAEGGSIVTTLDGITSDTTLYARYGNANEHTIYFDGRAYTYDDTVTSVTPINEGYAPNELNKEVTLTLNYQKTGYANRTLPFSVTSYHMGWTDDNDGGYNETIDLTNVEDGTHFTSVYVDRLLSVDLSEYNPDDNKFLGWFTEGGDEVTEYDGSSDATYYAHWVTDEQAIVTIDGEVEIYNIGDIFNLPASTPMEDDELVITFDPQNGEEVFTRSIVTSYTFRGFRLNTDNVLYASGTEFTVNGDMTFNSEYSSNTVGTTWPDDPVKENYEFLGWFTNQTYGIEVFNFDGIKNDTTLYARYTTNPESFITLTNTVTGETILVQKNTDWLFEESKFNKDLKEKLGTITYKFNSTGYPDEEIDYYRTSTPTGYYIGSDTSTLISIDEAQQFASDTDITPYYGDVETDSHVGLDQFDYEVTNGNKVARCFSKTNQDPSDIYDDEAYTCYENYDENDGNVTVYLHWHELRTIHVTEPDGHVDDYLEGDIYNTGVNDNNKADDGYTVTFKYQDNTTADTTQSHMSSYTANGWLINGNHVDNNVDITLVEDIVKQYDYTETSTTITLPTPTRDDYTFVGWNSRANGKGTTYTNESINSLDKDTTVYGIWTKDEIILSFVTDGDEPIDDITVGYDTPIGDVLPTSSKANERRTVNDENVIIGYIFDGWYREDTYENKVSSSSTFTEDTTLYAKFIEDTFPYVYPYHEEDFVCTGSNYIDTGVALYTSTNEDYKKDYEVGFILKQYVPSQQVQQGVIFGDKWEINNSGQKWPGIVFRRKDRTNDLEITQSINKGIKESDDITGYTLPLKVTIYRVDGIVYYQLNDGDIVELQDMNAFNQYFDINAYFCAGDNGSGGIQRYLKGTISDYYIRMGDFDGTMDQIETHTVTYPDDSVGVYRHNSIVELEANEEAKDDELGAAVTFDYNDDVTPVEIRYNTKSFTPNGFMISGTNDVHYDDYANLVVDEDKVIAYDYISETDDVEFPEDPTRNYYTFDGWYTEGGDKVEYYDGSEDITLYAHWTRETVNVIYPDETITVDKGEAYTLRTNDIAKADDNAATVTFKYHDEETEDLVRYVKYHYTANGWSINGTAYADEASITPTTDITVIPEYTSETIEVEFPSDPTYDNHEFEGWFTEETGGIKAESYDGTDDIILHAQWSTSLPTDFDLDSDDILIVKGDTHQIEVTFTPDGSTDTLTYTSSDDDVATVDADGLITGVETGVTTIMVSADNADIDKIITVTVVSDKLESEEYDVLDKDKEDESKDRIVIGAEVKTLISEFKDNMTNPNEYIKIYDAEGNEVSEDDTVKTGLTIKLEINGRVYDEAIMIVRGDIDGDGLVDVADEAVLTDHILRITPIDDYRFYAADVDEDSILDVADDSKLTDFILRILDSLNE